jgi:hypothetical protein
MQGPGSPHPRLADGGGGRVGLRHDAAGRVLRRGGGSPLQRRLRKRRPARRPPQLPAGSARAAAAVPGPGARPPANHGGRGSPPHDDRDGGLTAQRGFWGRGVSDGTRSASSQRCTHRLTHTGGFEEKVSLLDAHSVFLQVARIGSCELGVLGTRCLRRNALRLIAEVYA